MPTQWYRTTAWDAPAREEFEARLRRARADNRSQYLRIKARGLAGAGRPRDAEQLLRRLLAEYPDAFDAPSAMEALGDLAAQDGRPAEAVDWYRRLLGRRPDLNGTTGTARISLASALVRLGRHEEALAALDDVDDAALTMNSAVFGYRVVLAEAAAGLGDRDTAAHAARAALDLLDAPDQFFRHPGVGRARPTRAQLRRLRALARAGGRAAPSARTWRRFIRR
ncbi:tetratricopeptide repeat protein [Blastococcus mobilis]|uniref:tetratricopeptide repeat protein n=1 Tax=Blastococcus mobilis TaxID=1938746 RepID=UPI001130C89B|nr:tetratricopeptide repeat protein [Blastococcus mobilis]